MKSAVAKAIAVSATSALVAAVLVADVGQESRAHAATLGFPTGKGWQHPIPNEPFEDWGFDSCSGSYLPNLAHLGADSQGSNPAGTTVRSIASGTVRNVVKWSDSDGQAVTVEHSSTSGRFLAVYGHVASSVSIGQRVSPGQRVGGLYDLGRNTHLHLGIRPLGGGDNGSGWYPKGRRSCGSQTNPGLVNPIPWLAARSPGASQAPPGPAPNGTGDRLNRNQGLSKGHSIWSANGYYRLTMQTDGNLVLYGRTGVLRALHAGKSGSHVIMQGDGNLVLYGPGGAVWSSRTDKSGADRLIVQNDGNLVLYAGSRAVWSSNTQQPPNEPFGAFDTASSTSRLQVYVRGWAMDADAPTAATKVDIFSGSTLVATLPANLDRPDIKSHYPRFGSKHGFEGVVSVASGGSQQICAYAHNLDRGSRQRLGCKTVNVVAVGPPSAPTFNGNVHAGDGAALVQWKRVAHDGGSPVTGYEVQSTPGAVPCTPTGGDMHCLVTGLTNGTEYTFRVRARNAAGWSAWSTESNVVKPKNPQKCWDSDSTRDNRVDVVDLSILLTDWGTSNPRSDPSRDGLVNVVDLSILLSSWGPCPYRAVTPATTGFQTQGVTAAPAPLGKATAMQGLGGASEVVGRAADGTLFGHASEDVPENGRPVMWNGPADVPTVIDVPGVEDAVITDVNPAGVVVGTGLKPGGGDDHLAWYRDGTGEVGLLRTDGGTAAVALSVNDVGQISGFIEKGDLRPVLWDSTEAPPRYLDTDASSGASVTAVAVDGSSAGATVQDRLAIWSPLGGITTPVPDGEAIDVNVDGWVLFGSASTAGSEPRLRTPAGTIRRLGSLPTAGAGQPVATSLTDRGSVGGSSGGAPVVWAPDTSTPRPIAVPAGAEGRVLGLDDSGYAYGWTRSPDAPPQATVWSGVTFASPTPSPAPTPPPAPAPKKSPSVKVTTPKNAKLRIDVNPNLKGSQHWKVQILKKKKAKTVRVKTVRTKGPREIVTVDVPRGRYLVRVPAQKGYEKVTSKTVRVRR